MRTNIKDIFTDPLPRIQEWSSKRYLNLVVFNLIIMLLVLLRSAGYFEPYYLITVNLIVIIALILSIFLLGARVRFIFIMALLFWIFSGFLRVLSIDTWAERSGIYTYQALVVGVLLLIIVNIFGKKEKI